MTIAAESDKQGGWAPAGSAIADARTVPATARPWREAPPAPSGADVTFERWAERRAELAARSPFRRGAPDVLPRLESCRRAARLVDWLRDRPDPWRRYRA